MSYLLNYETAPWGTVSILLACDAASLGNGFPMFQNMLSQYLRNWLPSDMASFLSYTAVKTLQSQTTLDIQLVLLEIESRGTKL